MVYLSMQITVFCQSKLNLFYKFSVLSGWQINMEKTLISPTQRLKHLGFWIYTKELMYFSSVEKLEEIVSIIDSFLTCESVEVRKLAGLFGKINSFKK